MLWTYVPAGGEVRVARLDHERGVAEDQLLALALEERRDVVQQRVGAVQLREDGLGVLGRVEPADAPDLPVGLVHRGLARAALKVPMRQLSRADAVADAASRSLESPQLAG